MTDRFDRIDAALELKVDKSDIDGIYTRLDVVLSDLDAITTELGAQTVQLARHERWHHEVAGHVGLTLRREA